MNDRRLVWIGILLLSALVLSGLIAIGCNSATEPEVVSSLAVEPSPYPSPQSSFSNVVDPCLEATECEPRDVGDWFISAPIIADSAGAMFDGFESPSVETALESGWLSSGLSPTHIAFRGTARKNSVECQWYGIARTAEQREGSIRWWLGMGQDEELPSPAKLEATFEAHIKEIEPARQPGMRAELGALARGGTSENVQYLTCFVTYDVHEYILGDGTAELTVAYDQVDKSRSYNLYRASHVAGWFGAEPLKSERQYASEQDSIAAEAQRSFNSVLGGRQGIVFLAPMAAHEAITYVSVAGRRPVGSAVCRRTCRCRSIWCELWRLGTFSGFVIAKITHQDRRGKRCVRQQAHQAHRRPRSLSPRDRRAWGHRSFSMRAASRRCGTGRYLEQELQSAASAAATAEGWHAYLDAESDTHADTHASSMLFCNSYRDSHGNIHAYSDAYRDTHAYRNTDSDGYAYPYAHGHGDSDAYSCRRCESDADAHSYCDGDSYGDSIADTHSHCYAFPDSRAAGRAEPLDL